MSQKKVVGRSVAIALGIACIILIAGIGGAMAYYTMQLNDKNSTYNNYVATHSHTDSDYNSLSTQNINLQAWLDENKTYYASEIAGKDSQITDLQSIVNLQKQEVVVYQYSINQGASQVTGVAGGSYPYSGYLQISSTSTTSNAYVRLDYWLGGKLYSSQQTVGTSGNVIFLIPKTDSAAVYVGNYNVLNGATHTLTITYHY